MAFVKGFAPKTADRPKVYYIYKDCRYLENARVSEIFSPANNFLTDNKAYDNEQKRNRRGKTK